MKQRGYSLFGLLIASAVASTVVGVGLRLSQYARVNGDYDTALKQAESIAEAAEIEGYRVTASALDSNRVMRYTFGRRTADFRSVAALKAETGIGIPTQTPFTTEFEYFAGAAQAQVRFLVPATIATGIDFDRPTVTTSNTGSGVVVTYTHVNVADRLKSRRLRVYKRQLYQEDLR